LSRAAEKGDARVVELLLQNGASPDFKDKDGWTPLAEAVERGQVAVLQLLLARGVATDYTYNMVSKSDYI
jgi:ankyrin repeat protein